MESSEGTLASAIDIARRVRDGETKPVDVVREHLARIDAVEPKVSAFVVVRREEALSEAESLGGRDDLASLPLAGVPVAIKDNVDVAGLPTRHGSAATSDAPAERDDELVRRLRAAGCVVIGKTKMPELAIWPFTEGAAFEPARNPWNPERTTGGSSGGSGAAVAAGMVPLALGSDGGGSIRIPAACCGVFGLKPTPGIAPVAAGASEHWFGLSAFGPLGRTVADVALALDVLADRTAYRSVGTPQQKLRIAYSARHPTIGARVAAPVRAALSDAAELLRGAGHTLTSARPPYPANLGLRFSSRWLPGIAEDAAGLDEAKLEERTRKMARLGKRLMNRAKPTAADPFGQRAAAWLEDYDALLTPTLARPAVPVGNWAGKGWIATTLGVSNWLYTTPWNVAALPAASIPFGSDDGLPIGLQIVAPARDEETILALAAEIERLRPWPQVASVGT
jgi:amidase